MANGGCAGAWEWRASQGVVAGGCCVGADEKREERVARAVCERGRVGGSCVVAVDEMEVNQRGVRRDAAG